VRCFWWGEIGKVIKEDIVRYVRRVVKDMTARYDKEMDV